MIKIIKLKQIFLIENPFKQKKRPKYRVEVIKNIFYDLHTIFWAFFLFKWIFY